MENSLESYNEEENIHHNVEFFISFAKIESSKDTFEDCYQKAQIALTYAKYMNSDELVAYDEAFDQKMKRFSDYIKLFIFTDHIKFKYLLIKIRSI